MGRTCLLLQGGRRVADIGVLYPVAAMQAHARLDAVVDQPKVPGNVHPGLYVPPKTDLNELSDCLTGELRRDFTFLHPDILNDRCLVNGPILRLDNATNYQDYRVVILPSARVVHASNVTKIRAFCEAGGKVIVTTQVPCKSAEFGRDQEVAATVRALFGDDLARLAKAEPYFKRTNAQGGAAYFVPTVSGPGLGAALDDAIPVPDVRFAEPGPAVSPSEPVQSAAGSSAAGAATVRGMLSYLHKVKDGRHIYYVANSTDDPVKTLITIRSQRTLERWNPHDGSSEPAETDARMENGQPVTRVQLDLGAVQSVFLVETADPTSDANP